MGIVMGKESQTQSREQRAESSPLGLTSGWKPDNSIDHLHTGRRWEHFAGAPSSVGLITITVLTGNNM